MKLSPHFVVHQAGNETILVPTGSAGFSGVVKGNRTLGFIVKHLQNDISEEEIIASMRNSYDAPEEMIEKDVKKALAELRKIGAIVE